MIFVLVLLGIALFAMLVALIVTGIREGYFFIGQEGHTMTFEEAIVGR